MRACGGIGEKRTIDELLLVPNDKLSLEEGALQGWGGQNPAPWYRQTLKRFAKPLAAICTPPIATCPLKPRKPSSMAQKKPLIFQFDDGVRKVKTLKPSKASSIIWNGVIAKPNQIGRAKR